MMTFKVKVFAQKELIGHAELDTRSLSDEVMPATFFPEPAYYQFAQKKVREFNTSGLLDETTWSSLRLNIQIMNGYFLFPTKGIIITDHPFQLKDGIVIKIMGVDWMEIVDQLSGDTDSSFVVEPWEVLDIKGKLAFENELSKELAPPSFSSFKSITTENHALFGAIYCAVARACYNDDVLFRVYNRHSVIAPYVQVHLTWSSKWDGYPRFPSTRFYSSFEEFRREKMLPDAKEWEE